MDVGCFYERQKDKWRIEKTVIRNGRLRWYGHVLRENDEDWVNVWSLELKAEDWLEDQEWHD